MSPQRSIPRLSLCLLVLTLAGCTYYPHSQTSEAVIPWSGGRVNPAIWATPLDRLLPGDPSLTANQTDHLGVVPSLYFQQHENGAQEDSLWGFPYIYQGKGFTVDRENQSAKLDQLYYLDLGSYLLFLPLQVVHSTQHYRPGSIEPVGRQDVYWNLLQVGQQGSGDLGETRVEAAGLPLVWSRVSEIEKQSNTVRWSVMNYLWTLGPLALDINDVPSKTRLSISVPVMLASAAGPLLWMNLVHRDPSSALRMHGPLFGSLGYLSYINSGAADQNKADLMRLRLLLLGSLWMDLENEGNHAMHGPLWGCFGWGKYAGRPTIQLLWVPIPVGS